MGLLLCTDGERMQRLSLHVSVLVWSDSLCFSAQLLCLQLSCLPSSVPENRGQTV